MCTRQRFDDLPKNVPGSLYGQRPAVFQDPFQAYALDVVHDNIRLSGWRDAKIVKPDAVGMLYARHGLGFTVKALERLFLGNQVTVQHLDGDNAIEMLVPGLIDDTHAAPSQYRLNLVSFGQ